MSKLLRFVDFESTKTILEIGPGKGSITDFLIKQNNKIIAIEADQKLFSELQKKYGNVVNFSIIHADFLKYDLPNKPFIVVSNIPFNITADIIRKLVDSDMESAYLIMQKEAANKYLGAPVAHSSLLSHFMKNRFEIEKLMDIDRKNYTPKPSFDTSFVIFRRHKRPFFEQKQEQLFKDFLTYTFERRHTELGKALKQIMSNLQIKIMCKEIGLTKESNIKKIVFEDWVKIFKAFDQHSLQISKNKISGKYEKLLQEQSKLNKRNRTYKD
ncbi:MAG: ribosomal RNA small subunit methyltransferase A [Minisyncoccota bacterium]